MAGFTDVFGGSTLQAAQVAYAPVALSASLRVYWPAFCTGTQQPCARLMDVTPTGAGLVVLLPDATLAPLGQDVFFSNPGAYSYTVQDYSGATVAVITPGTQRYLYLIDNTTSAGGWRSILMGVGASSPDANGLAGAGLKAVGATLVQTATTSLISANYTFAAVDRAKLYVNTGGAIAGGLPLSSTVGNDYFFELRNQGTGAVTLTPTGGELIDGSGSIVLQLNESCTVHAGTGAWYTVGRGRNTQFNFTQLLKTVTGGTTTLSLTEASNVVQAYSGTATSNNTVVLPAVVQVYYVSNNVLGGYAFTLQSPTPGAILGIPYGQAAVVFCDGINVINASTSVGGITALLLAAGSAAAPSMAVGATNNGVFAPTSTVVAVSAGGTEAVRWSAGQTLTPNGTVGLPAYSFAGSTLTGYYAPAANQVALAINGSQLELDQATGKTLSGNLVFGTGVTMPANMTTAQLLGLTGAPKADGTGATGTWGIGISGTATTATTANALNTANGYTVNMLNVSSASAEADLIFTYAGQTYASYFFKNSSIAIGYYAPAIGILFSVDYSGNLVAKGNVAASGLVSSAFQVQGTYFASTSSGSPQFGGGANTGVYTDAANIAIRCTSAGGQIYFQSPGGAATWAGLTSSGLTAPNLFAQGQNYSAPGKTTGVTYNNGTARPITVSIYWGSTGGVGAGSVAQWTINGVVFNLGSAVSGYSYGNSTVIVQPGWNYRLDWVSTTGFLNTWEELS